MARPGPKPKLYDEKEARQVEAMAAVGITQEDIALVLGMNFKTLTRLYSEAWKRGKVKANAKVGERLYKKAVEDGDTASLIFWAKTQMGWRETQRVDHTSSDGSMTPPAQHSVKVDFGKFSAEELSKLALAAFRGKAVD